MSSLQRRRVCTMALLAAMISSATAGSFGCRAGDVDEEDRATSSALEGVDDLGLGDAVVEEGAASCGSDQTAVVVDEAQLAIASVPAEAGAAVDAGASRVQRPTDAKGLGKAKDDAKAAGKTVVLVFGSTTCLYCKKLLANLTTLTQRDDIVVIYVEVDTDQSLKDLAKKLGIESYPSTFIVPPKDRAKRFNGCESEDFVKKLLPTPPTSREAGTR